MTNCEVNVKRCGAFLGIALSDAVRHLNEPWLSEVLASYSSTRSATLTFQICPTLQAYVHVTGADSRTCLESLLGLDERCWQPQETALGRRGCAKWKRPLHARMVVI